MLRFFIFCLITLQVQALTVTTVTIHNDANTKLQEIQARLDSTKSEKECLTVVESLDLSETIEDHLNDQCMDQAY